MRTSRKRSPKTSPALAPVGVLVRWRDAESHDEWRDYEDFTGELPVIVTLGWLYKETKDALVVSQSFDFKNETCAMTTTIPKAWCLEIRRLRVKAC